MTSTNPIPDVPGGPGWIISGQDLRPTITDLDAFRARMADDPLADFRRAVDLRQAAVRQGGDPALLASSQQALEFALRLR